jgi:hypothetical protein
LEVWCRGALEYWKISVPSLALFHSGFTNTPIRYESIYWAI